MTKNLSKIDIISIKTRDSFLVNSINLPQYNEIFIKCKKPFMFRLLHGIMEEEILNMIDAGNLNMALEHLQISSEKNNNVCKNILSDIENKISILEYRLEKIKEIDFIDFNLKISTINKQIESLNIQYNSIKERIEKSNEEICPICIDDIENPVILDCCKQLFCSVCITRYFIVKQICPLCRKNINTTNIIRVNNNKNFNILEKNLPAKNDILTKILLENINKKIIIFTNYDETIEKIIVLMKENNLMYDTIYKNLSKNKFIIDNYINNDLNILIINSEFGGCGINLQNTDIVIFYNKFDDFIMQQSIGRAQRIGRINQLTVYYL